MEKELNYIEAVGALMENKLVRYLGTAYNVENPSLERRGNEMYLNIGGELKPIPVGCITPIANIRATWEIYEEEDNWNLAKQKNICGGCSCENIHTLKESDIKTFIQKVKEDVDNYQMQLYNDLRERRRQFKEIIDKRAGDL